MTPWSHDKPPSARVRTRRRASLAVVTAGWAFALLLGSIVLAWFVFSHQLWQSLQSAQGKRVENIALAIARSPDVVTAVAASNRLHRTTTLQQRIEPLRRALGVDFVVVMNRRAIRLTHPRPVRIGHHFRGGDENRALTGQHYVSIARGTLGRSVRGFAPVRDANGRVIGAVSVGITLLALAPLRARPASWMLLWLAAIALLGGGGTMLLAGRIKRQLMNMEPEDIADLVTEHRAVLDAMHEGLIVIDMQARLRLINPAAKRLLEQAGGLVPATGQQLPDPMVDLVPRDDKATDQPLQIGGIRFRGTLRTMQGVNGPSGCLISFRDTRELQRLGEELTGARRYARALRAGQHDIRNRLHVVLGLAETGDIAAQKKYLQSLIDIDIQADEALADWIREPTLGGFLLGKQSEARELGVVLAIAPESVLPAAAEPGDIHGVVSVLGNLLDNAFDAVAEVEAPRVALTLGLDAGMLSLAVQDNGHGMDTDTLAAVRASGVSTRGDTRGLGLYLTERQLVGVGGHLALYSTPGEGTLAEAVMPYATAENRPKQP